MEIKRFSEGRFSGLGEEHPQGCWVKASDLDRIQAERDALQLRLNEVEGENDRLMALLHPDRLSNIIREVDGSHSLGAGALAERIIAKMEKQS